ncbi:hypothetical protein F4777DRAFT_42061 [Nemania sp. FL0916]|nr:hypothetical protein F4777DRAFT_42061 [Nemania sp. FL0916]
MDPLAALGLAASVIQFVHFTSSLVKGTSKIYRSGEGKAQTLESIYQKLSQLSAALKTVNSVDQVSAVGYRNDLQSIAEGCRADSELLLSLISKLKSKPSGSPLWDSFRQTLREILAQGELQELRDRIEERERVMLLQLVDITRMSVLAVDSRIQALIQETRVHSSSLRRIASDLKRELTTIQNEIIEFRRTQNPQDLQDLQDIDTKRLSSELSNLSLRTERLTKEDKFLRSLDFAQREVRHGNVTDAHRKTLSWIFEPRIINPRKGLSGQKSPAKTGKVLNWLESGSGVFWISGKAGSGKSTAMKFIADHVKTKAALSQWSAPDDLALGSHYFWSAGTPEQKSFWGMLKSLIYGLISQTPRIIPVICPERWSLEESELGQKPWTMEDLHVCLQRLASQPNLGVKFCVFIDGLDEYDGDHLVMTQKLVQLSQSSNLKICLSSRPWNVFEGAFGQSLLSKLYIHEWTQGDILAFAKSRLTTHPQWNKSISQKEGDLLVSKITTRAEGVFLWVFLVTKLLREGLTNHDSIDDLNSILDKMPSDLGQFFMLMLNSVYPMYHQKMAVTLRIAGMADEPLHFLVYHFIQCGYSNPDYAVQEPVKAFEDDALADMRVPVHRHLNSRCMGLLELRGNQVQFIHRTVRDWLQTRDISDNLSAKIGEGFDTNLAMARAHLALMKRTHFKNDVQTIVDDLFCFWRDSVSNNLRQIFKWVNGSAASQGADTEWVIPFIEETGSATVVLFGKGQARFGPATGNEGKGRDPFFMFQGLLLESQVWSYLQPKLCIVPDYFGDFPVSPLAVLLKSIQDYPITLSMLQSGDLEELLDSTNWPVVPSLWTLIFQECTSRDFFDPEMILKDTRLHYFNDAVNSGVIRYLIEQHGANVLVHLPLESGRTVPVWLAVFVPGLIISGTPECSREWARIIEDTLAKPVDLSCLAQTYSPGVTMLEQVCLLIQTLIKPVNGSKIYERKRKVVMAFLKLAADSSLLFDNRDDVLELLESFDVPARPPKNTPNVRRRGAKRKRSSLATGMRKSSRRRV